MTKFIPSQELDFLAYRDSLKEYLKTQEAFRDYDYEGSNLAVLLDILALNTVQNAYYENMIGSEMFMDTALLKNSVVSRAKELNYTPRSRSAARTSATITFNTANSNPSSITIPKFYGFRASGYNANNLTKTYNFVTNSAVVVHPDSFGNFNAEDVMLYQGSLVSEVFLNNGNRFVLQSNTIDIDSIEVTIQASNTDTTSTRWERTTEIYGINKEANIYFVQAYHDDKYELVFGNDVIGRALSNANIVRANYITTDGVDGNSLIQFQPTTAVEGFPISAIVADTKTYGGSERETIDSIKYQAPRFFTTQERAVIESDFENLVRLNFTAIQSVIAYGGERLVPPQFGKVAISLKPFGFNGNVSDKLKNQIVELIKTKSMATPMIIDPDYFYVRIDSVVFYDPDNMNKSVNQLRSDVIKSILDFGEDTLSDFGSDFRYSKLISIIDTTDSNIVSNETTAKLIKRWIPKTGSTEDVKIDFGVPLVNYNLDQKFKAGQEATLSSSLFSYTIGQINYSGYFEDDGMGTIRIVSNNDPKSIILSDAGSINYQAGIVKLNSNLKISSYGTGYISIYVVTRHKDLIVDSNRFLLLDSTDIVVDVRKAAQ